MTSQDIVIILRQLFLMYGSVTAASIITNQIYYNNAIKKAFKDSKRTLKFKELTLSSKAEVNKIEEFCKIECGISHVMSFVPFFQMVWTVNNVTRNPNVYKEFLNEKMEKVNVKELEARKKFLQEMKKQFFRKLINRELPEDLIDKMFDPDYLPSESDYLRFKKIKRRAKTPVLRNHPIEKEHNRFWV